MPNSKDFLITAVFKQFDHGSARRASGQALQLFFMLFLAITNHFVVSFVLVPIPFLASKFLKPPRNCNSALKCPQMLIS